jgi:hypothetical protein
MKQTRNKPVVGEILIAMTPKNRGAERKETQATVTKVGRKYFTCRVGVAHVDFHLETWVRTGNNMHANFPIHLYRTEQEIRDSQDREALAGELSAKFKYFMDWKKLGITKLREIKRIIDTPEQ